MKILHTADWHLGQRLAGRDRSEEHRFFLDWLLETIVREGVGCLVVAGDVFDSVSPAQATMQIYYDFLHRLSNLPGVEAILVGGNHDSPAHLNAPRELLRRLKIHVVGDAPAEPRRCLIPVGEGPEVMVAAVPYLRQRDLRAAVPGESFEEREAGLREALLVYYRKALEAAGDARRRGVPVLATGHLTLTGGAVASGEDDIEIGHLRAVDCAALPSGFDYVALGHLHGPQSLGERGVFRYSGSPYQVNFGEAGRDKEVVVIELGREIPVAMRGIPVPAARRLLRYSGSVTGLPDWLESLGLSREGLPAWVEVQLPGGIEGLEADRQVREAVSGFPVEVLKVMVEESRREGPGLSPGNGDLEELSPEEVFRARCLAAGLSAEEPGSEELVETFRELLARWREGESAEAEAEAGVPPSSSAATGR